MRTTRLLDVTCSILCISRGSASEEAGSPSREVCIGVGGGLLHVRASIQWGLHPGRVSASRGVCIQGESASGGLHPGGYASGRVCIWEPVSKAVCIHGGGLHPGRGLHPGGPASRGVCIQGGFASRWVGQTPLVMWPVMHAGKPSPPPFPRGQNNRCLWKYYLATNFACGRLLWDALLAIIGKQVRMGCECESLNGL